MRYDHGEYELVSKEHPSNVLIATFGYIKNIKPNIAKANCNMPMWYIAKVNRFYKTKTVRKNFHVRRVNASRE